MLINLALVCMVTVSFARPDTLESLVSRLDALEAMITVERQRNDALQHQMNALQAELMVRLDTVYYSYQLHCYY